MKASEIASIFIAQGITPEITDEGLDYLLAASEETIHLDLDAVREAMWDQVGSLSAEENVYGWHVIDFRGGVWWPNDDASAEIEASDDPAAAAVRICEEADERGEWSA